MSHISTRQRLLACLLILSIALILLAARDDRPSQDVIIAIMTGELSQDDIEAGNLVPPTPESDSFFRILPGDAE